jgi:cysteine protease ATG4
VNYIILYTHQLLRTPGMEFFNFYGAGQQQPPTSSPIWMLGHCYECEKSDDSTSASFKQFQEAFTRLLWFTYRKDFTSIESTVFTSDAGWGCMLRSGQMVLGQALAANVLGDGSRGRVCPEATIAEIARWFADTPNDTPYSIHAIAKAGERYGKSIGEWFGPSTISHVLRELVAAHKPSNLSVYVSDDGAVYMDKVTELATSGGTTEWKPVLIIIPARLGLDSVNEIYYPPILETFKFPQSLGILGGKPRASLYFVAAQDDSVFYLDPHALQPTVTAEGDFNTQTYHCSVPKKAHVSEVDPSMALAFYCRNKEQFDDFCDHSNKLNAKHKDATLYTVINKAPDYKEGSSLLLEDEDEEDIEMDMDMVVL